MSHLIGAAVLDSGAVEKRRVYMYRSGVEEILHLWFNQMMAYCSMMPLTLINIFLLVRLPNGNNLSKF